MALGPIAASKSEQKINKTKSNPIGVYSHGFTEVLSKITEGTASKWI